MTKRHKQSRVQGFKQSGVQAIRQYAIRNTHHVSHITHHVSPIRFAQGKLIFTFHVSFFYCIFFFCFCTVQSSEAYFKDLGAGVRPLGMGGAFVAVADDANAVLWNASGLAQLQQQEIMAMYSALYTGFSGMLFNQETDDLGYHYVSYARPISTRVGAFGMSWTTLQSTFYDENTLALSYGRKLTDLMLGLNLKWLWWELAPNDFTIENDKLPDTGISQGRYTLDLSALYRLTPRAHIGFAAENLVPADVGLLVKQTIPILLRSGIAYRTDNDFLTSLEITYRGLTETRGSWDIRFGGEKWFSNRTFGIRSGVNRSHFTVGLSYRVTQGSIAMQLDYAFLYPLFITGTFGSHRFGIALQF